jgi:predicted ATPase/DNA-binding SARP family transcriptional activator
MLTIRTLGKFDILLDGVSLTEGADAKRGLFFIYLWEQRNPLPRLELAQLLWPSVDNNTAQINLRSLLLRLRREGLGSFLDAGRSTLALVNRVEIDYDVARLRALTAKLDQAPLVDLMAAADIYQGSFLQAVHLDDYPYLDEWAGAVRAEMEIRAINVFSLLVTKAITAGYGDTVLKYAKDLVAMAPYDDNSQILYIRALAAAGRVSDALAHFYQYRRRLQEEMQMDVGQELDALVAELKRPNLNSVLTKSTASLTRADKALSELGEMNGAHQFPFIEHPIVGRYDETSKLFGKLDAGSRLVTVLGIGGTGKTFFVRSQYEHLQARFGLAIYYADLRSDTVSAAQAADTLLLAIAASLNFSPQAGRSIFDQIVERLARQKSCLILDNFETVQSAADRVQDLLKAMPQLTILVTSRERLGLSGESLLLLGGLRQEASNYGTDANGTDANGTDANGTDANPGDNTANGEDFVFDSEAVCYFVQCLQRHEPSFQLDEERRTWIEKICQEVEGLPLAIELAAMQVPFYSLAELASQIGQDRSLLAGELGDLPGDHYSVWAVLDSMWQTLSEEEHRVLAELSLFAGAFHRDAMMTVAPASRNVYTGLINTSLLRVDEPAWFSLHPLVRQYATSKLTSTDPAHRDHAQYFLSWFDHGGRLRETFGTGPPSPPPLAVRCQPDVVVAWQWAIAHGIWDLLDRGLLSFCRYLVHTQQQEEISRLLSLLVEQLPPFEQRHQIHHRIAGRAAFFLGVRYHILPGMTSVTWFERALLWLGTAGEPWDVAACAMTYVDIMLGTGVGEWERVEAVLTLAGNLVETHQLEPLQTALDISRCAYYLRLGAWSQMRSTQASLISRIPHFVDTSIVTVQLWNFAILGDWQQLAWFIERVESDNARALASSWMNQWAGHYRCYLLANQGNLHAAINQRLAIVPGYSKMALSILLPMVHAELALWQFAIGDKSSAQASAAEALACIRQAQSAKSTAFGLLQVSVFHWINGEKEMAESLLRASLASGRKMNDLVMVFSSLYYLAQTHADLLPPNLLLRIVKIGAVSPVMHFSLRPLAQDYLMSQHIEIEEDERQSLWATNAADVDALLAAVEECVGSL